MTDRPSEPTTASGHATARARTRHFQAPSLAAAAFGGLCPRCGAKTLFAGTARFAPSCSRCDLDFHAFNVGDGPAAFLTLGIGTIVTILAVWLELAVSPSFWVHVVLWLPLTIAAILWGLRVMKAGLLYVERQRAAQEGRIADAALSRGDPGGPGTPSDR